MTLAAGISPVGVQLHHLESKGGSLVNLRDHFHCHFIFFGHPAVHVGLSSQTREWPKPPALKALEQWSLRDHFQFRKVRLRKRERNSYIWVPTMWQIVSQWYLWVLSYDPHDHPGRYYRWENGNAGRFGHLSKACSSHIGTSFSIFTTSVSHLYYHILMFPNRFTYFT